MTAVRNVAWELEEIFSDGDRFFAALEKSIAEATISVDVEVYIFSADEAGKRVAAALTAAARRGVRVRLIVDGAGSSGWRRHFAEEFRAAGAQFKVFHELAWERIFWRKAPGRGRLRLLDIWMRINRRTHRKVVFVDAKEAWIGSMNFTSCHLASCVGKHAWRDTGARVSGGAISEVIEAFEGSWDSRYRRAVPQSGLIISNQTRRMRSQQYRMLLRRLREARGKVLITTAYFVPRGSLRRAIERAARRGVEVRLLLPSHSDLPFMPPLAGYFYGSFLRAGVCVYEFQRTILHAKSVLIDDFACIGSTNLNHRSFLHDLEMDVVLKKESSIKTLERLFFEDLEESKEITEEMVRAQPFWRCIVAAIAYRLRRWM